MPSASLTDLIESFAAQRVVVVGDVMLDRFIQGNVSRISPEAPVPVVEVERETHFPGGAANVARNITPFSARVDLIGMIGPDDNGRLLRDTLRANRIGIQHLVEVADFPTITKTRVVARHQQVVRIDRETRKEPTPEQVERFTAELRSVSADLDGMIIEDYGKGLVTQELVDAICAIAAEGGVKVMVDPNPKNPIRWKGVSTVKPNRLEAFKEAGMEDPRGGTAPEDDETLHEVGRRLLEKWECEQVLVTLGEQGMMLFSRDGGRFHVPTRAKEVFDVSGAGDTAIAIFTLALCAGADPRTAADLSNEASGIVVGKFGTTPVEKEELIAAVEKGLK